MNSEGESDSLEHHIIQRWIFLRRPFELQFHRHSLHVHFCKFHRPKLYLRIGTSSSFQICCFDLYCNFLALFTRLNISTFHSHSLLLEIKPCSESPCPASSLWEFGTPCSFSSMSLLFGECYAPCAPSYKRKVVYANKSHFKLKIGILEKLRGLSHLSDRAAIFFNAISHGKRGSSLYVEISCSSFFRSLYPNAASLNVSALFSGHSKCFRTALSSTCKTVEQNRLLGRKA